jgi:hypothetical protein
MRSLLLSAWCSTRTVNSRWVAGALTEELDSTEKILNFWLTALRQATEGKCHRAAGFCCDVLLMGPASGKQADALQPWIEHSDGTAQTIWFP